MEIRPRTILRLLSVLAAVITLVGCAEREEILVGKRENIRAQDAAVEPQVPLEGSRPIALPTPISNRDWTQYFRTPELPALHPALGDSLELLWRVNIGSGDSRKQRITADPIVVDGRIFSLDADARVTAVTQDGAILWSQDFRPPRDRSGEATGGGLAYLNGVLFISLGYGEVIAAEAATGELRWRQQLNATASGSPLIADGLVYVVAGDNTGWAIDAENGRVAWQVSAAPSVANVLGAPMPVHTGGLIVFAFGSGDLIAALPKGGLRRWAASVAGSRIGKSASSIVDITGSPVLFGDKIVVGNHSGQIVAFDAISGDLEWTVREGALDPIWPTADSIFAISDQNHLLRIDVRNGQLIWRTDLPRYVRDRPNRRDQIYANHGPVLAGNKIVVASNDGFIRFFSPENGTLLSRLAIPHGATTAPVIANKTLFVVSTRGILHAFR
ncbi:MAG: PQQ-binding-like beta-propeller repeat protein [Aestuariivita sp.]|nr:PQQ-binding-like beta-propeller repeat protein [Aestuariivita sp.]MCY4347130.1 PQQ-binding-like beta-propeller repeat protein [Aestuariivita sp.]